MDYEDSNNASWLRRNYKTVIALIVILGLAAFFRVAFNYDPAINDGTYRYAGNDDYYHYRVIEHIQSTGTQLLRDDLLNYPVGAANPRPPLYNWHIAAEGRILEMAGMSHSDAAFYAPEWGSAFWGILTVIPIWLTGRFLYSNAAGLWAGFLIASSPAHIQRSGFGLGDHDGFVIFFLCLGFYFLVRALRGTRDDTRVASWGSWRSIADGFGTYADQHREGLAYAFLAGLCFTTIALAWEGYPYVTAIFAVYYVLQLLTNQIRRRDSTGDLLVMLIILATMTLVPLPYYWNIGVTVAKTVTANTYILAALIAISVALIPTRDLPSVIVLPGLALLGLVGWAVLTFVFPDIGTQVFTANGYFNNGKVYSTIAEAQKTQLGVFVFSVGFMTFFLAMVGFVYATIRFFKKRERDQLFIVGWGLISIYMAFAAARFVFNAAPIFAILAGWMVAKMVRWMNFRERVRDFQSLRQESFGKAVRSTLGTKQIAGSLFLGLILIAPNVWFSLDAALPAEARQDYAKAHPDVEFLKQQSAFGQSFLANDWIEIYGWLNTQDLTDAAGNPVAPEQRPGHMAWWDYGFWEVALGGHPTVADNFQNGFGVSGRFLTAQSEKEGIEWNTVRLLEGNARRNGGDYTDAVKGVLTTHTQNASLVGALPTPIGSATYDAAQRTIAAQTKTSEEAAELYLAVSKATGTYIGYFLTDFRMLPYDEPSTPSIESGSIYYAPTYLANRNPDDYVQTVYVAQGTNAEYRVIGYEVDADGNSRQRSPPKIIGPDEKEYLVGGNDIIRANGNRIDYSDNGGRGRPLQAIKLDLKPAFYDSMFYKGYVGGEKPAQGNYPNEFYCNFPNAGKDLKHYRLVRGGPEEPAGTPEECLKILEDLSNKVIEKNPREAGKAPTVRLLKFFAGAELDGKVSAGGQALDGVSVEAYDDLGIRHDVATTGADGSYHLLLPFGLQDETTKQLNPTKVRYVRGGITIAERSFTVSEAQANRLAPFTETGDLVVQPGTLEVLAYVDRDRNGAYNSSVDRPAADADVTYDGKTIKVGADGKAVFTNAIPGRSDLTGTLRGYTVQTATGSVEPGKTGAAELPFQATAVQVNGTVVGPDGQPVAGLSISITASNPSADGTVDGAVQTSDANGTFKVQLVPGGQYRFFIDQFRTEGDKNVTYKGEDRETVEINQPTPRIEIVVARTEKDV